MKQLNLSSLKERSRIIEPSLVVSLLALTNHYLLPRAGLNILWMLWRDGKPAVGRSGKLGIVADNH